jgi:hydrophobic/amphiphilic exporter-1 (mainly G- bacteria), HAE1 family
MKRSLPALAMARPVTVTMLLITLIGFGIITAIRIPIEFMPPMDLPFLGAFIPYPNATPAQVEQEIAIPAEGEFRTLPNLAELYTNSSSDGTFISMRFEWGTNMTEAIAEVRDRIERLRLVLPDGADRIFMRHFSLESIPIMQVGLARDGDYDAFADLVDREVIPKLLRLDGVADVEVFGYNQKNIMVDLDQQALLSHNVSLYELISTLNTANVDMGIGQFAEGNTKFHVRAESELTGIRDYNELTLSNGTKLRDIATGGYRAREQDYHFAIDDEREMFLIITKESEANTAATCKAVATELDAILAEPMMKGTQQFIFFNQGDIITGALNGLRKSSIYGGAMALAVLFLFLRRVRPTIIVAMAIPGSLVGALVIMYSMGMTLNLITMMSMIIAVGMVVDNAIVVIENIYRYQGMGYDLRESAWRGASEVSMAIVAATTTTVVVFLPVFYADSGQMSVFMRQFAIPVSVALLSSLVLALTVIPLAVSRFSYYENSPMERVRRAFGESDEGNPASKIRRVAKVLGYLNPVRQLRNVYMFFLREGMKHRLASFLLLAGFVAFTVQVPMKKMGFQQMPSADRRMVNIDVQLDPNYSMAMADKLFGDVEAAIGTRRSELGVKHVFKNYSARGGEISLYLLQDKDMPSDFVAYPYSSEEVVDILWHLLPERAPGAEFTISTGGGNGGGGTSQTRISVRLEGDDTVTLDGYTSRFIDIMEEISGITDIRKSTQRADQEIQLKIDGELANYAGLAPMQIAQTVTFALMGTQLSKIKSQGREIEVWAQFQESDRQNTGNLNNIMLQGSNGSLVPLKQLVTQEKSTTPQIIQRRNGKNFVYITGAIAGKNMTAVSDQIRDAAIAFDMPTGYSIAMGDEIRTVEEDQSNFFSILIMSIMLIFIVMSALFESCLLPLSILTSVPLAFLGVIWIMFATGTPMDTVAFIGCILMVGVVVNNGIVIVDHINNLRKQGLSRYDAIVQGGSDRLRPVLMTALTTILGAIPLAIGGRIGEPAAVSLGMSMIGGLTAGTFLTLFVVPLFYSVIDDAQNWLLRFMADIAGIAGVRVDTH